jgi:hypothetical protein
MQFPRHLAFQLAAPVAMVLVFIIGVAILPTVHMPKGVTSFIGPTLRPIGEPVRMEIPSLDSKAEVDPIYVVGETLIPPASPRRVGWWTESAEPWSPTGQTLMTGHATRPGGGYSPLNRLRDIRRGATISVWSKNRKATYVVQDVFLWSKKKIREHANDLFDPDYHDRRLVLVTSAGFDGQKWNANVIVFAYPV